MYSKDGAALPFRAADILLPSSGHEKWAVIACDQYTSQPEYWEDAEKIVKDAPSTLRITLPEIYLNENPDKRIQSICSNMDKYLSSGVFREYKDALVYVERTLANGKTRHGIVGAVDLEAYDYNKGSKSFIRPTEGTILERIPPRVKIRKDAPIESPHVMILIDDKKRQIIELVDSSTLPLLYDFELMLGGGSVKGYLVTKDEEKRIFDAFQSLMDNAPDSLVFAMGDGNHSLATAKACYEADKNQLSRYALAEIVNIHDEALDFEPIYRAVFGADAKSLLSSFNITEEGGQRVEYITECSSGVLYLEPTSALAVGTLQASLDNYLKSHPDASIDYIHGKDVVRELAEKKGAISFIIDGMSKDELFPTVIQDGALPHKTFSMGNSNDKRYYMECRKIK